MTEHCAWCGADYYDDEIGDELQLVNGDYKCRTCIVEECGHDSTWTDYVSSSSTRARFQEHCTECKSWRWINVSFRQEVVGKATWRSDDVE